MLLLFEDIVVGSIAGVFEHQGTQFGDFKCSLPPDGDKTAKRLREFIEFCKDRFERSGPEGGANASEFDQFRDVVASEKWSIRQPTGDVSRVTDAPKFHGGLEGEISWLE